jgi:hypothetical protein
VRVFTCVRSHVSVLVATLTLLRFAFISSTSPYFNIGLTGTVPPEIGNMTAVTFL